MIASLHDIRSSIISGQFGNAELDEIGQAIKFARGQLGQKNKGSLVKGTSVKFTDSRRGVTYNGVVEKVSIKNVLVRTTAGTVYKVPANMLEVA
jgi:small-conductance mechanosensitive channel